MRILAVDPGYERLGVAILEKGTKGALDELIFSDCIITSSKLPGPERLGILGKAIEELIAGYSPRVLAIETLFLTKNQKTAMLVAAARGVIIYIAAKQNLSIFEYSPLAVKMAVTGYGKSDKTQVTQMVLRLIHISKDIQYDDEYDAIAVGLTCIATEKKLPTK